MSDTEPTTLEEFTDDDAEPDPEQNADDIEHLIQVVEQLTDQVGTLADGLDADGLEDGRARSIDTQPTDYLMFQ